MGDGFVRLEADSSGTAGNVMEGWADTVLGPGWKERSEGPVMGEARELDEVWVEKAEAVVCRAIGVPEGTPLRLGRAVVTRELIVQIALELERVAPPASGMTLGEAIRWLQSNPGVVADDSEWPGWENGADGE